MDSCQKVLLAGTDLAADHPGFLEPVYRKRRQFFGELATIFRHGQQIPRVKVDGAICILVALKQSYCNYYFN